MPARCTIPWSRLLVHPESRHRLRWNGVVMASVMYNFIIVPLRIGFILPHGWWWIPGDILADLVFILDLLVAFSTMYEQGVTTIANRRQIARRYLRGWFTFDAVASFPLHLLLAYSLQLPGITLDNRDLILASLRINTVLKTFKVNRYINEMELRVQKVKPGVLRIIKSVLMLFMAVHLVACGFHLVVWLERDLPPSTSFVGVLPLLEETLWVKYFKAFYWSFVTMTGYTNTLPVTDLETGYALGVAVVGIVLYVTIVGTVGSLVQNLDSSEAEFRKKMDQINDFLLYRNIPQPLADQIRSYYTYLWESGSSGVGTASPSFLDDLPPDISLDIALHSTQGIFEKVPLFQGAQPAFINALALMLRPRVSLPGFYIIQAGEIGSEMYFLSSGSVEVLTDSQPKKRLTVLGEGSFFGEVALLNNTRRNAHIRALTHCHLFVLRKEDFDEVMEAYPEQRERVWAIAKERET